MALTIQTMETAHAAKGAKLWTYHTATDTKATVKGASYFDGAAGLLAVGDRIMIHASDADFDAHVASISAANVVVIAAVDAFA